MGRLLRRTILLLSCLFFFHASYGQGGHSAIEDVVNALKSSRVQDMTRYFDNFVPININNITSNYSHNQAELVLKDFLEKNPPHDFIVINSGSVSELSKFAIGVFSTPNGKYMVYILMMVKDKNYVVKEIRLTKE